MVNTFDFKRHICMVFELGEMNLRDLMTKFKQNNSQNGGIGISNVKLYARQLLISFTLVHKLKIIHADCKIKLIIIFYFIK
jgi:serine/threonine-protein kinase PRP4